METDTIKPDGTVETTKTEVVKTVRTKEQLRTEKEKVKEQIDTLKIAYPIELARLQGEVDRINNLLAQLR